MAMIGRIARTARRFPTTTTAFSKTPNPTLARLVNVPISQSFHHRLPLSLSLFQFLWLHICSNYFFFFFFNAQCKWCCLVKRMISYVKNYTYLDAFRWLMSYDSNALCVGTSLYIVIFYGIWEIIANFLYLLTVSHIYICFS